MVQFPGDLITVEKVDLLITLSVYWTFSLNLHPKEREAFSIEFQKNIICHEFGFNLSEVFISTSGELRRFIELSEYNLSEKNHGFAPSLQLLQGKWLLGIFAPTDQSVIYSAFQIVGKPGRGKSHLLSYYDIDHPKFRLRKLFFCDRNDMKIKV